MLLAALLWAQETAPKAADGPSPYQPLILMGVLFALFFFIVIRPQQVREKKHREMLEKNLKKNDEVVTNAGIIGIVHSIKEGGDEVTLKLEDNAKVRILRSSIARIVSEPDKEATKAGKPESK